MKSCIKIITVFIFLLNGLFKNVDSKNNNRFKNIKVPKNGKEFKIKKKVNGREKKWLNIYEEWFYKNDELELDEYEF